MNQDFLKRTKSYNRHLMLFPFPYTSEWNQLSIIYYLWHKALIACFQSWYTVYILNVSSYKLWKEKHKYKFVYNSLLVKKTVFSFPLSIFFHYFKYLICFSLRVKDNSIRHTKMVAFNRSVTQSNDPNLAAGCYSN